MTGGTPQRIASEGEGKAQEERGGATKKKNRDGGGGTGKETKGGRNWEKH